MACVGRNGGHLTAAVHEGFVAREKLFGRDDALREIALEQYNIVELLKVITEASQATETDVVSGGHVELLFTEAEYLNSRADFLAAQEAGVDVRFVEWLSKDEVQSVSTLTKLSAIDD
jgi:hypothetical protein